MLPSLKLLPIGLRGLLITPQCQSVCGIFLWSDELEHAKLFLYSSAVVNLHFKVNHLLLNPVTIRKLKLTKPLQIFDTH